MDPFWLELTLRWLHIFAAIAAVGGTFFVRLALLPAIDETLSGDTRTALHAAVRRRWSKVIAASIAFLLVSGLVNYLVRIPTFDLPKYYHPLIGTKMLLALALFFIASVLAGRSSLADRFRQNLRFWVNVNVVLAILIVGMSCVLKVAPHTPKAVEPVTTTSNSQPAA